MTASLHSAVYRGWVRHRRHHPHAHAFRYRVAYLFLDLDEIDAVMALSPLCSSRGPALAEFRRGDYHGAADLPLAEAVRNSVEARCGSRPNGPIRLLSHARYFGFCFNPVSFYYCYEADGQRLHSVLAEITNTPWRERHAYVLPMACAEHHGSARHFRFDKAFHVSPFLPLSRRYDWRFQDPGEDLRVHMDVHDESRREFDATLVLRRQAMSRASLHGLLWRYPAMTLQVVAAIHWQALQVWWKRNPVYDHPSKSKASS